LILEHALLSVRPGQEADFESSMSAALAIIEFAPGCLGAEVRAQLEDPSTYLLIVRWERLEDHVEGFRGSELFERWRELTHPFYVERPEVTHFAEPIGR
jgi:heme-degrading monooxygenase HmoA